MFLPLQSNRYRRRYRARRRVGRVRLVVELSRKQLDALGPPDRRRSRLPRALTGSLPSVRNQVSSLPSVGLPNLLSILSLFPPVDKTRSTKGCRDPDRRLMYDDGLADVSITDQAGHKIDGDDLLDSLTGKKKITQDLRAI